MFVSYEAVKRGVREYSGAAYFSYNLRRSHQGYRLARRTPAQALQEALGITELPPVVVPTEGEGVPSAA